MRKFQKLIKVLIRQPQHLEYVLLAQPDTGLEHLLPRPYQNLGQRFNSGHDWPF
jgi:hypothetical protein